MTPSANIVLTGGRVWCGKVEGVAEAVALWNGVVLATGSADEIAPLIGPDTRVIELEGRMATPGLNDAHLHLLPLGLAMAAVDVRANTAPTLAELKAAIRARAEVTPKGQWIFARGYDQTRFQSRLHPTADDLDEAAPDHPVYLMRTCGHLSVVNTRAMELAGLTPETPVPHGGVIEQKDGRLTGLLAENGRAPVEAVLPQPSEEHLVAAIERAGRYCLSLGITSVMDAAVGMICGARELAAYRTAQRTGRLPVRTYQCLLGDPPHGIAQEAAAEGLITGHGCDMLRIGPVKIFTDGSAGGRTAAMTKPYLSEPEVYGVLTYEDADCHAEIARFHGLGYQMAIHAIGDAAIEQVLAGYEKALDHKPLPERRHRIEHCGFVTPDQRARMKRLGLIAAPQPSFIYEMGDGYFELFDEARRDACYPLRTFIEDGLVPSASTDTPVTDANTFNNIFTMLTRQTRTGAVIGPDQTVSLDEALHAYTWSSAFGEHAEHRKGRLVPGQLADVAVFSHDLSALSPEEIRDEAACDLTIRGGEIVYQREGMA
ncbi:MAG: amidohydrolase [Pseudomonadota bacterium]